MGRQRLQERDDRSVAEGLEGREPELSRVRLFPEDGAVFEHDVVGGMPKIAVNSVTSSAL
jgi:hypothetical protein